VRCIVFELAIYHLASAFGVKSRVSLALSLSLGLFRTPHGRRSVLLSENDGTDGWFT
jgi:hypothetical protein